MTANSKTNGTTNTVQQHDQLINEPTMQPTPYKSTAVLIELLKKHDRLINEPKMYYTLTERDELQNIKDVLIDVSDQLANLIYFRNQKEPEHES